MKKLAVMMVALGMSIMAVATQCAATTLKGTRCRRSASPGSQYCWQHGGRSSAAPSAMPRLSYEPVHEASVPVQPTQQVPYRQCEAVYKNGPRCNGTAAVGSKYCLSHTNYDPENPPVLKIERLPKTDEEYVEKTHELLARIQKAIAEYEKRNPTKLPSNLKTLRALLPSGFSVPMKDAWGNDFEYEAEGLDYAVASPGKDGKFGTSDDMKVSSIEKQ